MNRILLTAAALLVLAGVFVTPAAADFTSSYYQPASWQVTAVPDTAVTDENLTPTTPVSVDAEPASPDNAYQDAFTEPSPVGGFVDASELEKPATDMVDKDCYDPVYGQKGGKGGGYGFCPCWTFTFDGLIMRREHMDAVPLVVGPAGVLLDADDIGLSHRAGLRLSAARQINYCNDIEFEFFYVDQWSAFSTFADPGAQFTVYGAAFGTDPITMGYGNDLYSFELNWRRAWGSRRFKTLIGFRMMELDENMTVFDAASPPPLFDGDIDNHLIGFQIGAEGIIWQSCRWEIEGGAKMGVYYNSADFDAAFPQAGPAAVFNAAEEHTTFAAEVWLGANYCVSECLSLRVGYQALWIEGVAVLPEQLDDLAVPILGDLDMGGSPFYHGLYLGAQIDW